MTLVLIATGALAGACGASKSASATTASGADTATTLAEAVAFAQAVNLRAGDLPASQAHVVGHESVVAHAEHADSLSQCEGKAAKASGIPRIKSPLIILTPSKQESASPARTQHGKVESVVYAMANAALARQELRSARECVGLLLARRKHLFTPLHAYLPGVQVAELRLRFPSPVTIVGLPAHLYSDEFVFVVGRAEVALRATDIPRPFPAATEQYLLSLLYSRAKAYKL